MAIEDPLNSTFDDILDQLAVNLGKGIKTKEEDDDDDDF